MGTLVSCSIALLGVSPFTCLLRCELFTDILGAGNLESKQAEAERLRKERTEMEKKLKLYESKILQSENNDVEAMAQKAAEREAQLKQKREQLEKR